MKQEASSGSSGAAGSGASGCGSQSQAPVKQETEAPIYPPLYTHTQLKLIVASIETLISRMIEGDPTPEQASPTPGNACCESSRIHEGSAGVGPGILYISPHRI